MKLKLKMKKLIELIKQLFGYNKTTVTHSTTDEPKTVPPTKSKFVRESLNLDLTKWDGKGVYYNKNIKRYQVTVSINGKKFNVGSFKNKEEAIYRRLESLHYKYKGQFFPFYKSIERENYTSNTKGVCYSNAHKKWRAYSPIEKENSKHLGYFDTEVEAITFLNNYLNEKSC